MKYPARPKQGARRLLGGIAASLVLVTLSLVLTRSGSAVESDREPGFPVIDDVRVESVERSLHAPSGIVQQLDRKLVIQGTGFFGTAFGPFVSFEGQGEVLESPFVILESATRIVAWAPEGARGTYRLVVENPDRRRVVIDVSL
jgi:hypothetical protein